MEMKYNSIFKNEMHNYISYEKSMNFKNISTKKLKDLDMYFVKTKKNEKTITEDNFNDYIYSYSSKLSEYEKYSILLRFSKFLIRFGNTNVFFEEIHFDDSSNYEPYIYSDSEINKILHIIDNQEYKNNNSKYIYPVIFRLLISTGMRISEVLNLKYKNIDLNNDSIDIILSKEHISRKIYISKSMKKTMEKYLNLFNFKDNDKLFNTSEYKVLKMFKNILNTLSIKPLKVRLHDLRHTMATKAYINLINKNIEPEEALLYLQIYMGHSTIPSTEYYLHMTDNMQNDIKNKMKQYSPDLFPKVKRGKCNE